MSTSVVEQIEWRPIETLPSNHEGGNVVILLWSDCDGLHTEWLLGKLEDSIVASGVFTHWADVKGPRKAS